MNPYYESADDDCSSVTAYDRGCSESPGSADAHPAAPPARQTKGKRKSKKSDAFDDIRSLLDEYRPLAKKHWKKAKRKLIRQHNKDRALIWRGPYLGAQEYEWSDHASLLAFLNVYVTFFTDASEDVKALIRLGMYMCVWLGFRMGLNLDRRQPSYWVVRLFADGQALLWLSESVSKCVGKA